MSVFSYHYAEASIHTCSDSFVVHDGKFTKNSNSVKLITPLLSQFFLDLPCALPHSCRSRLGLMFFKNSGMVYEDAEKLYAEVRKDGEALLKEAFDVLLGSSSALTAENVKTLTPSSKIVGFNTTFFERSDIIEVPLVGAGAGLKSQVLQTSSDGKVGYAVMNCPGGGNVGFLSTPSTGLHAQMLPVSGVSLFSEGYGFTSLIVLLVTQFIPMDRTISFYGIHAHNSRSPRVGSPVWLT